MLKSENVIKMRMSFSGINCKSCGAQMEQLNAICVCTSVNVLLASNLRTVVRSFAECGIISNESILLLCGFYFYFPSQESLERRQPKLLLLYFTLVPNFKVRLLKRRLNNSQRHRDSHKRDTIISTIGSCSVVFRYSRHLYCD